jgi:hypothetical protein
LQKFQNAVKKEAPPDQFDFRNGSGPHPHPGRQDLHTLILPDPSSTRSGLIVSAQILRFVEHHSIVPYIGREEVAKFTRRNNDPVRRREEEYSSED